MAEILRQLRLVVYPIICRVFYIPRGAGFLPSTVVSFLYFVFSETAPLMPSIPAGCELWHCLWPHITWVGGTIAV